MASAARAILAVGGARDGRGRRAARAAAARGAGADRTSDAAIVTSGFEAISPCPAEADYATGTDTVVFGFFGTRPASSTTRSASRSTRRGP
jgi:hypothetical protein